MNDHDRSLRHAVDLLVAAQQRALVVGDPDAGGRLGRLAQLVEVEANYAHDRERAHVPVVHRSNGAPVGATIGWFLRYDAAARAARRLSGLPLPDDPPEVAA